MPAQRYERVSANDVDAPPTSIAGPIPNSPPPSFRSRNSSPTSNHRTPGDFPQDDENTLAETFDDGSDSDDEDAQGDDRQRLMRGNATPNSTADGRPETITTPPSIQRRVTELPSFVPPVAATRTYNSHGQFAGFSSSNDGVFANLDAKPERGEKEEEQPPSYEQAAADATPPYWETTIMAPGMGTDEVYIDGLPVGSVFSFVWNAAISTIFQLVGFLLTYLLHTTHAAKNGSRAGLGVTIITFGYNMRSMSARKGDSGSGAGFVEPENPNDHNFDPNAAAATAAAMAAQNGASDGASHGGSDWIAWIMMIAGWFILMKAVVDFMKARRHEQLILQSPDRGLSVPAITEGETMESAV